MDNSILSSSKDQQDFEFIRLFFLILKKWKLILIFSLAGGLLAFAAIMTVFNRYTAVSIISVNTANLPTLNVQPISLVNSDLIREEVAHQVGVTVQKLPEVNLYTSEANSTIRISVEDKDAAFAKNVADTWANVSVDWILENVNQMYLDLEESKIAVEEADQELLTFLSEHNLNHLTWQDIVIITGIETDDEFNFVGDQNVSSNLTTVERDRLAELARKKNIMEWSYFIHAKQYYNNTTSYEYNVFVLNYSNSVQTIEQDTSSKNIILIFAGALAGFCFSIIWIVGLAWLQENMEKYKNS